MNIAAMNEQVMFQTTAIDVDKYGNHTNSWIDLYQCHATVTEAMSGAQNGDETATAGGVIREPSITVTIRWTPQAEHFTTTSHRILFHDEIYNILSIDHFGFNRKAIKFRCRRAER